VQSELLQEIDRRFRELDIEIPFPQRDFHLRSVDSPVADSLQASTATGDSAGTRTETPDN
jgi:small-conductance mechanosensitive channel